jgi:hypothetical protein
MLDKDTGINSENNRSEIILKSDSEEKINRNRDSQIYLSQKRKHITVLQVLSHCLTLHLAKWGVSDITIYKKRNDICTTTNS